MNRSRRWFFGLLGGAVAAPMVAQSAIAQTAPLVAVPPPKPRTPVPLCVLEQRCCGTTYRIPIYNASHARHVRHTIQRIGESDSDGHAVFWQNGYTWRLID